MWIDLCPGETTVTLIIRIMSDPFSFKYRRAFSTYCSCVLLGNKYEEILKPTETQGKIKRENAWCKLEYGQKARNNLKKSNTHVFSLSTCQH